MDQEAYVASRSSRFGTGGIVLTCRLGVAVMLAPWCGVVGGVEVAGGVALVFGSFRVQYERISRPEIAAEFKNFEYSCFWPFEKP